MTATTDNPIDNDDRLKKLLRGVGDIRSPKEYKAWLKKFLKIYNKYLDANGILNGKDSNYRLLKQLKQLARRLNLVHDNENAHNNEDDFSSAKSRRLLTNLTDQVEATHRKIQEFLPKTEADTDRFGFNKFELSAVLMEDGFYSYDEMNTSRVILEELSERLNHKIHTNEISILHKYSDAVESFVRVMDDLGLINLMHQCVGVVYEGTERPEPKAPPPISNDDELPEDASIISNPEDIDFCPQSTDDDDDDSNGGTGKKKKKKKKKGKTASTSSRNLGSSAPKKKKKKAKSKKGGPSIGTGGSSLDDTYATTSGDDTDDHDDEDETNGVSSSPSKAKRRGRKGASKSNPKNRDDEDPEEEEDEENEEDEDDDDEEEEDEDENEGQPPVAEFLFYFDPKTNAIGRIEREAAVTKSNLIIDPPQTEVDEKNAAYADQYKNVIEDPEEKQQIIVMLKKAERQKPKEETSWLDEIKKEKAVAANNGTAYAPPKKVNKSTAMISKRGHNRQPVKTSKTTNKSKSKLAPHKTKLAPHNSSKKKKGVGVGTKLIGSGGNFVSPLSEGGKKKVDVETMTITKNPLDDDDEESSKRSSGVTQANTKKHGKSIFAKSKEKPKSAAKYQNVYKQVAEKPDSDGWSKPASSRRLVMS